MSNYPPPPEQPAYEGSAYIGQSGAKPTSVTVLAIIGIIISALMLLCMPFGLIFMFIDLPMPNPALDAIKGDPMMRAYNIVNTVFMLVLMIVLLFSSIAALGLKSWARGTMVIVCVVALVYMLIGSVLNFVWVQPKMEEAMRSAGMPVVMNGLVSTALGLLFQLPYPICVLYFFTRPHVKQAFEVAEATAV